MYDTISYIYSAKMFRAENSVIGNLPLYKIIITKYSYTPNATVKNL